jgi:hypothetical protein
MSNDDFEIVAGSGNISAISATRTPTLSSFERSLPPGLSSFWTSAS